MTTLAKSAPLAQLGLPPGEHLVRLRIGDETVSFEVEASFAAQEPVAAPPSKPTGFLRRWGGSMRRIDDPADPWLTHINRKHLR